MLDVSAFIIHHSSFCIPCAGVKSWNRFGTFLFLLVVGVLFCPPPQRVVEVSVANRNGALGRGGRTVNFGRHGEPVPAWQPSTPCAAGERCTCRSRAPWPAWPAADFQNSHPANIPVSKSR